MEFDTETPYSNVEALIAEFERFCCGGDASIDPQARRVRVVPALAFAVLVMSERISALTQDALASCRTAGPVPVSPVKAGSVALEVVRG